MGRKLAREVVFKLIYEHIITGGGNNTLEASLEAKGLAGDDGEYITRVIAGVTDNYDEITQKIARFSIDFSLNRIYKTDLAALVLAVYEIDFMPDIPVAVTINECLNLAKLYGTERSAGFINGILASILKEGGN